MKQTITTTAVWTRLEETLRDGAPYRLHTHQAKTFDLLGVPDVDVVINKAMTGDGKTLAAQLQTLLRRKALLTLYPTNELIRDQHKQIAKTEQAWNKTLRPETLYSDKLDELVHVQHTHENKGLAIKRLFDNHEVILTNPDIFHYLAQFYYTRPNDAPDWLFGRALDNFNLFVFDEFHIFQIPQIVSILNALLLIREVWGTQFKRKFLFLSATPLDLLETFLKRADFRVQSVGGDYLHSNNTPDTSEWRRILHPTTLTFHSNQDRIEGWVEAHAEDILLAFFQAHRPNAKGALIVNSVASAYRIAARLKPLFLAQGLRVELNTGLTGEENRALSYDADLLIGTSTIDVGVDSRINFLVFESRDSGTFLQRLGRLGRHDDDGQGHRFQTFEAHALVPNFVMERLFEKAGHPLVANTEYARERLRDAILEAYPTPTEFTSYAREWGGLQCARIYFRLSSGTIRGNYERAREALKTQYKETFSVNVLYELTRTKRLHDEKQNALLEEVQSFRGGSPFTCGVIDETERGTQRVKAHDLLRLAANFDIEFLTQEEFGAEATRAGVNHLPPRYDDFVAHFRLWGPSAKRRRVAFWLDAEVSTWSDEQFGVALVRHGIKLDMNEVEWLNEVNDSLRRRNLVTLLCLREPNDLRYRLYLPPLFELYPFAARDGAKGTIAFARDALLLHVAMKEKHFECGGNAMIL